MLDVASTVTGMRRNEVPGRLVGAADIPQARLILDRYLAAYQAAEDALRQEIEATPIDDEAWAAELAWRAAIAAWRPGG